MRSTNERFDPASSRRPRCLALALALALPAIASSQSPMVQVEHDTDRGVIAERLLHARGLEQSHARADSASSGTLRLSGLRIELQSYSTGGKNLQTPESSAPRAALPSFLGFDHGESFYADFEAKPNDAITGRLSINFLGNVPRNPIDEIFYERRGRQRSAEDAAANPLELQSAERVKAHHADIEWNDERFIMRGFYRRGHLHWQDEGDFFGLYHDARHGEEIDSYDAEAPIGFQLSGKQAFEGAKIAMGPELWWGANPALFLKYRREVAGTAWTAIYQEDLAQRTEARSSIAIPQRETRKLSLQFARDLGSLGLEAGVLWAGQPRRGDRFQIVEEKLVDSDVEIAPGDVREDEIGSRDMWGYKGKANWRRGRWNWYGQGAYMGLVAEGGPTAVPTLTDCSLRDSGSGNQINVMSGLVVGLGDWQVGPNLLWQKPIVGPMPGASTLQYTQGRPRNVFDDPFAVRANRETTGAEFMLSYGPTPTTGVRDHDDGLRENARLAASAGIAVIRHHTTADAGLFVSPEGSIDAFSGSTPARDWGELWELRASVLNRLGADTYVISHLWLGTAEPNGDDPRLVRRFGLDTRIAAPSLAFAGYLKINDYGPYDYHRDFNFTYPAQIMGDLSFGLGTPGWFDLPQTRFGVRATYRTLDHDSNRYAPDGQAAPGVGEKYPQGLPHGREWEIRTYLQLSI